MVADLEGWSGRQAFLVVDDFHALEGTPAEGFVARLVEYAPASLVVLARRPAASPGSTCPAGGSKAG